MCVGIYGVYDLTAAWHTDLVTRPNDRPAEKFLGVRLIENRKIYFEASPISYATKTVKIEALAVRSDSRRPALLLAWGTEDRVVPQSQGQAFELALNQAGFVVRTVILQGAPHF